MKQRHRLVTLALCSCLGSALTACGGGSQQIVQLDGGGAFTGLIQGRDGAFYGTTAWGGQYGYGTVFRVTADGNESVLYSFAGTSGAVGSIDDGAGPFAPVVQGPDGSFYGTTVYGGASNCQNTTLSIDHTYFPSPLADTCGTVFKVSPTGQETLLHYFTGGTTDGSQPQAGLVLGSDGNFYGVTTFGGAFNEGALFKITPDGSESVLYSFGTNANDAQYPGSLIEGADGNFYGTTILQGNSTIFGITPAGKESALYSFGEPDAGPLIVGANGSLYGTLEGSNRFYGEVYMFTPPNSISQIYVFTGIPNVESPGSIALGSDGNFYGTAGGGTGNCEVEGETVGCGTVFELDPNSGQEEVLYSLPGTNGFASALSNLVQGADGNLYGTSNGGQYNLGSVYRITPEGVITTLWSFNGAKNCVLNSTC